MLAAIEFDTDFGGMLLYVRKLRSCYFQVYYRRMLFYNNENNPDYYYKDEE